MLRSVRSTGLTGLGRTAERATSSARGTCGQRGAVVVSSGHAGPRGRGCMRYTYAPGAMQRATPSCSSALATAMDTWSAPLAATTWQPSGRPSEERPSGTAVAGSSMTLKRPVCEVDGKRSRFS